MNIFLTKGAVAGDDETFYMHCLRCYVPKIARTTFSDHLLGVGVFTMQGCERRNKETKRAFAHYCNRKGNVQKQTLNRLFDEYYF